MPVERDLDNNPVYIFGEGDLCVTPILEFCPELLIDRLDKQYPIGEMDTRPPTSSSELKDVLRIQFLNEQSLEVFIAQATVLLNKIKERK